MNGTSTASTVSMVAAVVIAAVVFAIDIATPAGFAAGVPYVVPVLLFSLTTRWRLGIPTMAVAAAALTIVGFSLSSGGGASVEALADRLVALLVIFACAGLTYWRNSTLSESVAAERATRLLADRLEDSEKRFRDITDSASDWIWEMDRDLRFTYVSDRFFEVIGIEKRDVIGKTRLDLAEGSPDLDAIEAHVESMRRQESFRDFSYRMVRSNGSLHRILISGTPIYDGEKNFAGYRGTGRNLTDHDIAYAERDRALDELRTLFDHAPDGNVVIGSDGRILRANQQMQNIFGYDLDDLIGQPVEKLLPKRFRDRHAKHRSGYFKAPALRSMGAGLDLYGITKDGREFPVDIHLSPVHRGNETLVYASVRDVTSERKTHEQLLKAQRLDALGKLTGGIAHDFNNLLSTMMGGLQLAERRLDKKHPAQKYLTTCLKAAQNGSDLTKRLMMFAKQKPLPAEPVRVGDLLEEVVPLVERAIDGRVEFNVSATANERDALVMCDRSQCVGAILNLVLNARDALTTDWDFSGRVSLGVRCVALDSQSAGRISLQAGRYIEIAVTDNGPGMPPKVVEQAMEPFFTTKGVEHGTGLGLSMVYGFAKQSKGTAQIYSELGNGTTVRIVLPEAADGAISTDRTAAGARARNGSGERILVVEDQPELLETTVETVSELGYHPIPVASGKEAVDVLVGNEDIDLVFSDVVMPGGMTGMHLAEIAKSLRPDLKVVLTTGFGGDTLDEASRRKVRILQKPYSREHLAVALARELDP